MRVLSRIFAIAAAALVAAAPASAAFELSDFDVTFVDSNGNPAMVAGTHPYAMTTLLNVTTEEGSGGGTIPTGAVKVLDIDQIPGLAGIPEAVPRCSTVNFLQLRPNSVSVPECADSSAIGVVRAKIGENGTVAEGDSPVWNLEPSPGTAAKLGFWVSNVPTTVELGINENPPYNVVAHVRNISQMVEFFGSKLTVWGNPASSLHDEERGGCFAGGKSCPGANIPEVPFLILPRACEGPLETAYRMDSWLDPASWVSGITTTHDELGNPQGMGNCGALVFDPVFDAKTTNHAAVGPTGLDIGIDVNDEGLANPTGTAKSDMKKAVVTLPEGVTVNASQAEGLSVCSEEQLARETVNSAPGEGCPQASKIGIVEVESQLVEGSVFKGSVFVAEPYRNPFGSLLALYMTIKEPQLGVSVKLAGRVEPDPTTGQLVSTFGEPGHELPQLPISHFRFHLREGGRSPLVTPPICGTYVTKAEFIPWADPDRPYVTSSHFEVTRGVDGGVCQQGSPSPFRPGFEAGSINNAATAYSPFVMRLTRRDGDQDMTRFSATLPPGVTGKLAGVAKCGDAAIEAAKHKSGREEQATPSCPTSSELGWVLAAAGVGSQLTYVPGRLYLGGPFNGDPLSVVAMVPAVAGPFDVGNVVTRVALTVDPETGQVMVDGSKSDAIPHILAGIPLNVREIRVAADRSGFTLNPSSCKPSQTLAKLFGSFVDVFDPRDDTPISLDSRYQAAGCGNLPFKPALSFRLKGGTQRGDHPALRGTLIPRRGDANVGRTVVTFPHSAFLEQGHIRTLCTRVAFKAGHCPAGSIYGRVEAKTPLLDEVLKGPVYLRSSSHLLPDIVFALKGIVEVDVVTRIDSTKGRIRATIDSPPDLPVSKFVLRMQGGKKGLIVNSRNLCAQKAHVRAALVGQNGRESRTAPLMVASNCKPKRHPRP